MANTVNRRKPERPPKFPNIVGILKACGPRILQDVYLLNAFRAGPTLLLKIAFSTMLSVFITYLWYSYKASDFMFSPGRFIDSNSISNENLTESDATGGLRMVVFGGGDVATPTLSSRDGQGYAWTEVMCQKLGCDTYISFIPKTEGTGGAVLSNTLLDAAYKHVNASKVGSNKGNKPIGIDYSWATEQYPKPHQLDLATQIDYFLATPRRQRPPAESLWVFNIGYWDIWYLAALPRGLATEVLNSSIRELFFQIERLYYSTKNSESSAFPGPSPSPEAPVPTGPRPKVNAPFRIFLTRLFDISLTPGFASKRPKPPSPHSSASQLRNAAFLTEYWNILLEAAVDNWHATPDPESWSTADAVDIKVVEALAGKRPVEVGWSKQRGEGKGGGGGGGDHDDDDDYHHHGSRKHDGGIPSLPRRQVASYGISQYLRELMIDRQLRDTDLFDGNGLGARPPEDGFLDISTPCALDVAGHGVTGRGEAAAAAGAAAGDGMTVCQEPDNYLFYSAFTVGQRAIHEIGVRAARRFLDQVEATSGWREKARMHKEGGREHNEHEMTRFTT
ncbi:hypothetical protein SAMD00023353_8000330 [Rosellinia necatrix]|uniref:Uncharacterized protein n=1 Tax=Rosellinia necatrix TaxID=77044 RepID=A0A1W2TUQ9_ROSNE|nr:hypothetical protein SAMD00023353_8000330 [Rosellinia necatrix]